MMKYSEISQQTGIPEWEVRLLVERAINKLKYQLTKPEFKDLREYWMEMFNKHSREDEYIYY